MPKYRVTIIERHELAFDVEAESEQEATDTATTLATDQSIYNKQLDDEIAGVEEIE